MSLCVPEICRHCDHGLGHGLAEELLGIALELHQDAGRDLLGGVRLVLYLGAPVGSDVSLDGANRAFRVGDRLALCLVTYEHFAVLGESNDGRGRAMALRVGNDARLAALENGDDGVGRSEVDADGTWHGSLLCDVFGYPGCSTTGAVASHQLSQHVVYNLSASLSYSCFLTP